MGGFVGRPLYSPKETRIIRLGLDNAGKTTILYKLALGKIVICVSVIEFNTETAEYKNMKFTSWDISESILFKKTCSRYYKDTDAIIFVVKSSDKGGGGLIEQAKELLFEILEHKDQTETVLLVLVN